ncbi:hypothetical protein [Clostridium cellulovorans]|uniref:Pectate lyase superfamily protein domain-containing protein n=1 Tax=Clostridium cellulovorans (strain ATCC 35296 / DSM 3052 / OCM 3 / 743B) TaxID=573061 RepID=D9SVY7_CLOC7|nr:hypothetical protein [Clostridium cellulovorans]ADL53198.1 hypothetical protein Clocel_3522 [Clostridium cellulovorans 743B]
MVRIRNKDKKKFEIGFLIFSLLLFSFTCVYSYIDTKHSKVESSKAIEQISTYIADKKEVKSEEKETVSRALGNYPIQENEIGVTDERYSYGDVRRYGVFPDDNSLLNNYKLMKNVLDNASTLGYEVFFPTGLYKTQLNISQSNVTIRFEEGAELTGLVHVFVEDNKEKIKNLTIKGTIVTYDRFGTRNIDGLTVDAIHVKSDGSKATDYPGVRGRGVHLSPGTTNMKCKLIEVDDLDSNGLNNVAAVEVDGWIKNPSNLQIDKIWVKKSDVHGVYLTGNGHNIGEIQIDEFGADEYKLKNGLEDSDGIKQSQELKGVWLNRCSDTKIKNIIVNNANTLRPNVKCDVFLDEVGKDKNTKSVTIGNIKCSPKGKSEGVVISNSSYIIDNVSAQNSNGESLVVMDKKSKAVVKNIE